MSRIWHIVRKDILRLRLVWGLWLVTVPLGTVLLGWVASGEATAASYESLRYFSGTWQMLVRAVGFVLAAWLVMEDSLVSDRAYWLTRPISAVRMFGAKVLGALLMFVVAPVVVLTPLWVLAGLSLPEWSAAAFDLALPQMVVATTAFLLAGMTATPGQFLVRAVGLWVFLPLYLTYLFVGGAEGMGRAADTDVVASRIYLILALLVITPLAMIVHQFLTRRTGRSCILGAAGLSLMLVVKLAWPWSLISADEGTNTQGDQNIALVHRAVAIREHANHRYGWQIDLQGDVSGVRPRAYLRTNYARAYWVSHDKRRALGRFFRPTTGEERPPELAVHQVTGDAPSEGLTAEWRLEGNEQDLELNVARENDMVLEYDLNATVMGGQLVGEVPLRVGAELKVGSSYTCVTAIERNQHQVVIRLLERDAGPLFTPAEHSDGYRPSLREVRPFEDVFVVRSPNGAPGPSILVNDVGFLRINSLLFSQRELILTPPNRDAGGRSEALFDWEQQVVILKTRFRPEARLTRRLVAKPFAP